LEVALGDFFEGSSNSMTLRRKPAPHQWALSQACELWITVQCAKAQLQIMICLM
jgi:hypothetical protein